MGIFSKNGIIKSDGAARSIRQSRLEESAAAAHAKTAQKKTRPDAEAVSDDAAGKPFFATQVMQTAYVRLKTRLPEVGAKFDPEMYVAGVTIAWAYIQNESRIFSDFVMFMLSSFGEAVRPHLLSFYAGICHTPDVAVAGLTSYEECLKEHAALMQNTA